jgi:hypothetical protein
VFENSQLITSYSVPREPGAVVDLGLLHRTLAEPDSSVPFSGSIAPAAMPAVAGRLSSASSLCAHAGCPLRIP